MNQWIILFTSLSVMIVLFAIAWLTDKYNAKLKKVISGPVVYSLSLTVFVTGITFYSVVGWAAKYGINYMAVFMGATLAASLFWVIQRKLIRISKAFRITSIADFISSRYGKSSFISAIVTLFFIAAIIPYISMQFRDIAENYNLLAGLSGELVVQAGIFKDTVFFVALVLAVFTIMFGTRHLDASERHEGVVAAVAFQALVKLLVFVAVGIVVIFVYNKDTSLFSIANEKTRSLFVIPEGMTGNWISVLFISMAAMTAMPHMFQVAVVENDRESNLKKASWIFPLYLFFFSLFIFPLALYGVQNQTGNIHIETFFIKTITNVDSSILSLAVFTGGLAAAAAVSILALISISTMISNNLFLPVMLRSGIYGEKKNLSGITLFVRRSSIVVMVLIAYVYFRLVGQYIESMTIKMISFVAVAQLTPALFGGLFWEVGNKKGVLAGLFIGLGIWAYTLILPWFIESGFLPISILVEGIGGIHAFRPYQLFGLTGFDPLTNATFWSMTANWGMYFVISVFSSRSEIEANQARMFVQIYSEDGSSRQNRSASMEDITLILSKILGMEKAQEAINEYRKKIPSSQMDTEEAEESLIQYAENLLAGAVGGASARVLLQKVVKEKSFEVDDILDILDETKQAKEYTIELEDKSRELEHTAYELHDALREMNLLKQQQDGDYFLTSLLQKPLGKNDLDAGEPVKADFIIKQKKSFRFRKWKAEIGGDFISTTTMKLKKKTFTVFINADAMGKSIQGAGGAIVLGGVFQSILNRTLLLDSARDLYPEQWLKLCFLELQKVFESFNGSMTVSAVIGIIDNKTGTLYYINGEHPFPVLYRNKQAVFIPNERMLHKIGMPDLPGSVSVNCLQLEPGDAIFVGSDGKDDISFGGSKQEGREINEDEKLFLEIVEKNDGDLQKIFEAIQSYGEITDDLSVLKLTYSIPPLSLQEVQQKENIIASVRQTRKETDLKKATARLTEMLEKDPYNLDIIRELGVISYQQKNYPQALLYFEDYVFRRPIDENALFYTSVCYKKIKEFEKAMELGERVRIRNPEFINNYLNLAEIYLLTRNYDRGIMIAKKALEVEAIQPEAQKILEALLEKKKEEV